MSRRHRLGWTAVLVPAVAVAGCGDAVQTQAARAAADPACSRVLLALPEDVGGEPRREVTAQATAAWGEPPVVLRCGVDSPGPTTEECVRVEAPDGAAVDWVVSPEDDRVRWTTFGRVPAVELQAPADRAERLAATAAAVSGAVALLPAERSCS